MLNAQQFTPTPDQIRLAEATLVAMTHEDAIRPVVEQYEQAILSWRQYPVDSKWLEMGVEQQIITNRKRTFLLSDEDSSQFFADCNAARINAKLKVSKEGNCPLLEAEHVRIQAENALIQSMATFPGLEPLAKGVLTLDLRKRALDIMLVMLAPLVGSAEEILQRYSA